MPASRYATRHACTLHCRSRRGPPALNKAGGPQPRWVARVDAAERAASKAPVCGAPRGNGTTPQLRAIFSKNNAWKSDRCNSIAHRHGPPRRVGDGRLSIGCCSDSHQDHIGNSPAINTPADDHIRLGYASPRGRVPSLLRSGCHRPNQRDHRLACQFPR